jgi:hypothetical protein
VSGLSDGLAIASSLLALAGTGLLFIPGHHAVRYARRVTQRSGTRPTVYEGALERRHQQVLEELKELRDGWRWWKSAAFYLGFACYAIAAIANIGAVATDPPAPVVSTQTSGPS